MNVFQLTLCLLLLTYGSVCTAQFGAQVPELARNAEDFNEHRLEVGVKVTSNGSAKGITATFPVPQNWPEQTVRILEKKFSPEVSGFKLIDLDGATQAQVFISQLFNGQTAEAIFVFEVRRVGIRKPTNTEELKTVPRLRVNRDLKKYLYPSPAIESRDKQITQIASKLVENKTSIWDKTEAFYGFVHEKIRYQNGPLKGAVEALKDGTGDCEEMTSLFIALCRAENIPARTVWVPGHCYPEFLVELPNEKQRWIPVEMTNNFPFGQSPEYRPILQKGDSFKLPGSRTPEHYVKPELKIRDYRGATPPAVQWVPTPGKEPPGS